VKDATVAARYARALFILTERRSESERALEDLRGLREVLGAGSRVSALLASPQVLLSDKRTVLHRVLENRTLRSVAMFVDLLLRKKRLREFDAIVAEFEALIERKLDIRRARVTSAVPLTPEELQRLHAELERTTGSNINLTTELDPDLLGGALVRIGDHVIDRSVRTLLDRIQHQLAETSV